MRQEEKPAAHDLLEREAVECLGTENVETIYLSVAISLKRIADLLDGTTTGICVTETLLGGRRS
jgi:hypothetical protein